LKHVLMTLALITSPSAFAGKTLLDCSRPRDRVDSQVCASSLKSRCDIATVAGVVNYAASLGRKVTGSVVTDIEPDVSYRVDFRIEGDQFGLDYAQTVSVMKTASGCIVSRIEGAGR
jgi:hypothetical protein